MSSCDGAYGFGPKGVVYASKSFFDASENKCGICLCGGATVKWINASSEFAHPPCLETISSAFKLIENKLEVLFSSPELATQKLSVRREALKALDDVLEGSSLMHIVKTSGVDKLAILIINVALPIIDDMHKKLS